MENSKLLCLLLLYFTLQFSQHFEIKAVREGTRRIDLRLEERADLIPAVLQGSEVVLGGFVTDLIFRSLP